LYRFAAAFLVFIFGINLSSAFSGNKNPGTALVKIVAPSTGERGQTIRAADTVPEGYCFFALFAGLMIIDMKRPSIIGVRSRL